VRADGVLLSLTYQRDQEVTAWARHTTDGYFESVACIPGDTQTDVWFVVRRVVDGVTKRYVEYLNVPFRGTSTNDTTCRFLDSALTTLGARRRSSVGLTTSRAKPWACWPMVPRTLTYWWQAMAQ